MIKAVLIDVDNTLLDFDKYVKYAMRTGFEKFGFKVQNVTEELRYNRIDNVETEYEKMFKNKGMLAYGLVAKKV